MIDHEIVDVSYEELPFKIILHQNRNIIIKKHWHRSFELSFTLEGKIDRFMINDKFYSPRKGDILVINSNEVHSIVSSTKEKEKNLALTLIIPYDFMCENIPDFKYKYYQIPDVKTQTVKQLEAYVEIQKDFIQIFNLTEDNNNQFYKLKIYSLVYDILYNLTVYFSCRKNKDLIPETDEVEWINAVLLYIQENLIEYLTVGLLAEQFNLSTNYFSKKFKQIMNISVMNYIYELRLQNAYYLVIYTNKNIQFISDQCGFPNIKTFIRVFKNKYNCTPLQYRKALEYKMT
ncbi:AraC family transcriptional regulator (plasmid) [Vagococcus lutrae]|uniref:AraC family transcriptional regulator n=1 Tax=Vagococcus lutrae TaxID=81947 RepID=UPI00232EE600|nr:helix-turn-helix domain-containing protein [Vagococcus lutrae]WCG06121.1 AraC family transcriptional regulator [Vagococcus lutrae]